MIFPKKSKQILLHVLRLFCKYFIAYRMFSYAFGKILKTQFNLGPVNVADYNVSDFNGFMLTWYYYGFSRTYALIIAGCQIAAGILILFRKTERIGVILLLAFMVNIVLINIFYDIAYDAMMMSIKITLMGLFLLLTDWNGFKNYFFKPSLNNSNVPKILTKYYWLPLLVIPILLYVSYNYINDLSIKYDIENELVGVWKVPHNMPSQEIFKLYFDNRSSMKIKDFDRKIYFGYYKLNDSSKIFNYNIQHYTEVGAFKVQDSLNKLDIPKDSIKSFREKIINHYNQEMNVINFKNKFDYTIEKDTLILIDSLGTRQFFVNISKEYEALNN